MPRNAQVSIIIPTYSRPHLLPRAVDSARAAGTDIEIIIVDDASVDETAEVCRQLTGVKYLRLRHNLGTAAARNAGILASSGRYIAFLDDDDLRLPGSLDAQAQILEDNPEAGFACGGMVMADQEYKPTGSVIVPANSGDVFWDLLELSFPVMPLSTLIRRACFLRVGLLNQTLVGIDDWDMLTRIGELYPVAVSPAPVGIYRQPTPQSGQGSSSQARQLARAARHQLRLLRLPRSLQATTARRRAARRQALNRIADTLLWNSLGQLRNREFGAAYENISTALITKPLRALRPNAYKKLAKRIFVN